MEAVDTNWRKSSHSGNGGDCVEVGNGDQAVKVRDTKANGSGAELEFSAAQWRRFTDGLRAK
jgi:hypothetical protein